MWVWFVGVAMGMAYVLEASLKKLAPMIVALRVRTFMVLHLFVNPGYQAYTIPLSGVHDTLPILFRSVSNGNLTVVSVKENSIIV